MKFDNLNKIDENSKKMIKVEITDVQYYRFIELMLNEWNEFDNEVWDNLPFWKN